MVGVRSHSRTSAVDENRPPSPVLSPSQERLVQLERTLQKDAGFCAAMARDEAGAALLKKQILRRERRSSSGTELAENRRRVSELLDLSDVPAIERELRSLPISTALYASVMGGVTRVLSSAAAAATGASPTFSRRSREERGTPA